jgi:CheY-like chemotaxis protein
MGRGGPKRKTAKRAGKAARRPARAAKRRPSGETALAALAHDIRTPLTGILALAELLAASDLPERERGWAKAIKNAAEHLAQSTSLVLDAVKAGAAGLAIRREVFSPRRLAESVSASLSARAGTNGLSAEVSIAGDVPTNAIGDQVRLRAALENLIDNAIKFTARGRVSLDVTAAPSSRNRLKLAFAVTDSGIGLTQAEIRKLFRPFAQASADVSRKFGGTGLGLVLVKRLAKAMGGDLAVASKKGQGSTFTLTALVSHVPATMLSRGGKVRDMSSANALRILCAEDNPFGRVVLSAILTELGHRVDFAGSGEAAVNAVARGGYDLVLMDVTLPDVDGLEATRRIHALPGAAAIPVIGISALSSLDDERRARGAGMSDYLVKPISSKALAEALQRIRT